MSPQLENKRCLIIGGASGIGRAAAERFRAEGASVAVVDKTPVAEPYFINADAGDSAQVAQLFPTAVQMIGGLDVLYHVAGISGRKLGDGSLHECSDDGWDATVNANLKSVFLTNRAAIRHFLAERQPGVILNMASVLALSPSPRYFDAAAYTAAKGGVISLSRLAAARYATDRIRVNVIAPGLIDTPMAARAVGDPAIAAFLRTKQPIGNGAGTPDDCAGAAVFLCSDAARFITGAVLPVDGGWSVSDGQYPLE
jgi:NAD(P)-dependent dehydrogenase (short-subunit alcohol dehydrogenase family)